MAPRAPSSVSPHGRLHGSGNEPALRLEGAMRDLLEGLAALDPLLAALDRRGFVAWMSPAWAAARGGLSRCLGRPLIDLLLEQVDASDESGRSRLRELFSHLEDLSAGAPARRIRLGSESLSTTGRVEIRVSCTPDRS